MAFDQIVKKCLAAFATVVVLTATLASYIWASGKSEDIGRYFYSGDGTITLYSEKTGKSFSDTYRKLLGRYNEKALNEICRVFDAPKACMKINLYSVLAIHNS